MLVKRKNIHYAAKGRILKCVYCGNSIFSIEDDSLDLKDSPSFISPKHIVNVKGIKADKCNSDRIELFCCRCGVSLGYKLIDGSGRVCDSNYIRVNMLEVSPNLQAAA